MSEASAGEFEKVRKREKYEEERMLNRRGKVETQSEKKPELRLNKSTILLYGLYLTEVVVEMRLDLYDKSNRSIQD